MSLAQLASVRSRGQEVLGSNARTPILYLKPFQENMLKDFPNKYRIPYLM